MRYCEDCVMARSSLAFYQRHFPGVRWVEESKVTEEQRIIQSYADEIISLKEQLTRTERERDQAIIAGKLSADKGEIMSHGTDIVTLYKAVSPLGSWGAFSDLYAHLAGKVD